jgi:deoxycytidine triphosphate deaminase
MSDDSDSRSGLGIGGEAESQQVGGATEGQGPVRGTGKSGGLLGRDDIEMRLNGGYIFRPGTWEQGNIRGASYDIRMAEDLMIVPDPPNFSAGRRYPRNKRRQNPVVLNPGDVAFVSSRERLCFPWDIAGNLGPKFGLSSKGILILTGFSVDPGYGLEMQGGNWFPKEDERLHFFLANVGSGPVVLIPGQERIATLQFFASVDSGPRGEIKSSGYVNIEQEFFAEGSDREAGLVFFRNMVDLRSKIEEYINRIGLFEKQIEQFEKRISAVESGSHNIVFFGVFLLSSTLIGVALAAILALMANTKGQMELPNAIVVGLGILSMALITVSFMRNMALKLPKEPPGGGGSKDGEPK